jgi:hypothetical protein
MLHRPRPASHVVVVVLVVLAVLVLAVGGLFGHDLHRRFGHRRNVDAFQRYALSISADAGGVVRGRSDASWVKGNPGAVLAAGDRACRWLSTTPRAPHLDPTLHFAKASLVSQYLGVTAGEADASPPYTAPGTDVGLPLSAGGRSAVVDAAWTYLCWSTKDSHTARAYAHD